MPADLSLSYLGLPLDDRDPQGLFDAALERFQSLAPEARLRNGSIETMLLEAWSTAAADVIYALNRVPATVVESILALYGIPRLTGATATGQVTVVLDGSRTVSVPAGVQFRDPATGLVVQVSTTTTVTGSSIVLPVVAEASGSEYNDLTTGTALDIVDDIPYSISASVTTALTGGSGAESDADFFDRASARFARVTSSLVIPEHFVAYALEDGRPLRVTAVDLFQPGGTAGSDIGHITVYVWGRGAALSAPVREDLREQMQAISSAAVTVHVADAGIVTQPIAVTVKALAGFTPSAVQAAVQAALAARFDPAVWPWGRDILTTEIIEAAAGAAGVDYVETVATPAANVALSASQLAQAGTITVTVT